MEKLIEQEDKDLEMLILGSAKADRRVPKTCLGQVFSYKLGCFDDVQVLICVDAHPHL